MDLELVLLGKPRVGQGSMPPVRLAYNKSLALLAYLATTGRAHSRDELAGLLWGEMPDQSARANLRKVLADLNAALPSHLEVTRQAVALNPESARRVDVTVFAARLQGKKLDTHQAVLDEYELRQLSEAVELYQNDFLAGFYIHDAPAFEDWVLVQREHFRHLVLNALHRLAKHHTACGAYATGIEYTTRLLHLEPWHEEFHQQMMLLLALGGRRSAALRQYEICRSLLDDELGVAPSPDTMNLLREIQTDQIKPPDVPATPPHNLPAQVTAFVGRQAERQAMAERLRNPHCRLLTLVGISGSGKTRLALQAAAESLATFPDGSFFVPFNTQGAASDLIAALLTALKLHPENGQDAFACLLGGLRNKHILLVLDGLEHLPASGGFLMELLHAAPGIKLLVTSLEHLGLEGEWVLSVHGLEFAEAGSAAEVRHVDAVQWFLQGARRVHAGFAPAEADIEAIVRLCQLVDGLPLAIELASSWVHVLSVQEITQEVVLGGDVLSTAARSSPERHRSLGAALTYSLQALTSQEQSTFRKLSVFEGGISREAAEQVAGACLPDLAKMVDCCLLQRTSPGRYAMPRIMRQFGTSRLAEDSAEQSAAHASHCAYYLRCLQQRWGRWQLGQDRRALDEIATDMGDIEAAWTWAMRHSRREALDPLAQALTSLLVPGAQPREDIPAWRNVVLRTDALLTA